MELFVLDPVALPPAIEFVPCGDARRAVVRRFPFAVFYEVMADEILILAVYHSRRDPERWKARVG
jgi:plasmid stabilization system protein ParE